MKEQEIW